MFQRRTPEAYLSLGVYRIESAPFRCGRCYFKFCLPDNRPGYILPVAVLGEICELLSDNTIVCFAFLFLLSSIFTVQFFFWYYSLYSLSLRQKTEFLSFLFMLSVFMYAFLGLKEIRIFFVLFWSQGVSVKIELESYIYIPSRKGTRAPATNDDWLLSRRGNRGVGGNRLPSPPHDSKLTMFLVSDVKDKSMDGVETSVCGSNP